jgi:hypothetical protein
MMTISIYRPFRFLFTEPIVFFFSLWSAFAWGVLYLSFGSIPLVFMKTYGMNIETSGYMFAAMVVGAALGMATGIWQDSLLRHPGWAGPAEGEKDRYATSRFWLCVRRNFPVSAPESRLYFTCVTSILLPIGLFLFGFTAKPDIHWISPALGIGIATWGIYSVYLATFNYLADSYTTYASSALASQSFCRNVLGGVFPLVTGMIFENLGEVKAGAMLGSIAAGLTLIPWVLVFYGEKVRARSKLAVSLRRGDMLLA